MDLGGYFTTAFPVTKQAHRKAKHTVNTNIREPEGRTAEVRAGFALIVFFLKKQQSVNTTPYN
jgi:hypothetical protein